MPALDFDPLVLIRFICLYFGTCGIVQGRATTAKCGLQVGAPDAERGWQTGQVIVRQVQLGEVVERANLQGDRGV